VKQHSRRRGRQEGLRDGGSLGLAARGRGIWEVHLRGAVDAGREKLGRAGDGGSDEGV